MALVLLHVSYSQPEAKVLKTRLEHEGIPTFNFDAGMNSVNPHMGVAVGGIRIMVPEEHLNDARKIIADRLPSELESESDAFAKGRFRSFFGFVFSLLFAWLPWWNRSRKFK